MGLNLWQKTVIVALSLLALARVSRAQMAGGQMLTLAGAKTVAAAAMRHGGDAVPDDAQLPLLHARMGASPGD